MAKHCVRLEKDDNYASVKSGLQERAVGEGEKSLQADRVLLHQPDRQYTL